MELRRVVRPVIEVTAIVTLPLIVVAIVSIQSTTVTHALTPSQKLFVDSAMFAVLTFTGLKLLTYKRRLRPIRVYRFVASMLLAWVGFVFIVVLAGRGSVALSPAGFAIFVAAAAEELVFRIILPSAIAASAAVALWKTKALIGVIAAQLVFALSHVMPIGHPSATPMPIEVSRLVVAGVMYAILLRVGGLWLSTSVHASLNVEQFFVAVPVEVSVWMITLTGFMCIPFIGINSRRAHSTSCARWSVDLLKRRKHASDRF